MNTARREFMITAGKGIMITAALPVLNACGAIGRGNLNHKYGATMKNKILSKDHFEILRYASLAPSGHNSQPWEIEIAAPGRWRIKSNPNRWLPMVDPENREGTLSIGPFIENLVLAAGSLGYKAEIKYLAASLKEETVAEVVLTKNKPHLFPLHKIETRRTVRNNYLKKSITPADIKHLTGNDAGFHFLSPGSAEAKLLAEGTLEANRIQAFRDEAQSELSRWIRFSNSDAEKYRNGLTPASMELSGFASLFVRMFYSKGNVMSDSFRQQGIENVKKQVESYGGWLIITSNGSGVKNLIETGRKFQRMLLKIREKMIAVHPMMQLLEEGFRDKVQTGLGINEPVQFILRTGYLEKYPNPVSLRRPVGWFVV